MDNAMSLFALLQILHLENLSDKTLLLIKKLLLSFDASIIQKHAGSLNIVTNLIAQSYTKTVENLKGLHLRLKDFTDRKVRKYLDSGVILKGCTYTMHSIWMYIPSNSS